MATRREKAVDVVKAAGYDDAAAEKIVAEHGEEKILANPGSNPRDDKATRVCLVSEAGPLRHNGHDYAIGEMVELTRAEAEPLMALGVVEFD